MFEPVSGEVEVIPVTSSSVPVIPVATEVVVNECLWSGIVIPVAFNSVDVGEAGPP